MPLVCRLRLRDELPVGRGRGQKASSNLEVLRRAVTLASSSVVLTMAWAARMATPPCLAAAVVVMWSVPPFRPLRGASPGSVGLPQLPWKLPHSGEAAWRL